MLTNEELLVVVGGAGFTATLMNSLSRLIGTVLNLGQTVGSSIRRAATNSYCKTK